MKKTIQEVEPYTDLFSELCFIAKGMREAKEFIQATKKKTAECKRNCAVMARELYVSKLSHKNNLTNNEKFIATYLLNGDGEDLEQKFNLLLHLLKIRRDVLTIIGEGELKTNE